MNGAATHKTSAVAKGGQIASIRFGGSKDGAVPDFKLQLDCSRIAVSVTAEVVGDWRSTATGRVYQVEFMADRLDASFDNMRVEIEPPGSAKVWNMTPVTQGSVYEITDFFFEEQRRGWPVGYPMPWGGVFTSNDVKITFVPQPFSKRQLKQA